ncbi:MAG: type II toxin-antitoxin system Phd/YefM family antitoxin [Phycisphaerales bacterium JB050]
MTRTTDITSFTDLRKNLRVRIDRVRELGRPLFVTTNGQTDAVVLSPEQFDELVGKAELLESVASIERGMRDGEAGRVRPMRDGIKQIADELGITLDR